MVNIPIYYVYNPYHISHISWHIMAESWLYFIDLDYIILYHRPPSLQSYNFDTYVIPIIIITVVIGYPNITVDYLWSYIIGINRDRLIAIYCQSWQVQEAAGDLAAFLKEAKAAGEAAEDTPLAPRARRGQGPFGWDEDGKLWEIEICLCLFLLFFNECLMIFGDFCMNLMIFDGCYTMFDDCYMIWLGLWSKYVSRPLNKFSDEVFLELFLR